MTATIRTRKSNTKSNDREKYIIDEMSGMLNRMNPITGSWMTLATVSQIAKEVFFWREVQLYRSAREPRRYSRATGIHASHGFFIPVLFAIE